MVCPWRPTWNPVQRCFPTRQRTHQPQPLRCWHCRPQAVKFRVTSWELWFSSSSWGVSFCDIQATEQQLSNQTTIPFYGKTADRMEGEKSRCNVLQEPFSKRIYDCCYQTHNVFTWKIGCTPRKMSKTSSLHCIPHPLNLTDSAGSHACTEWVFPVAGRTKLNDASERPSVSWRSQSLRNSEAFQKHDHWEQHVTCTNTNHWYIISHYTKY